MNDEAESRFQAFLANEGSRLTEQVSDDDDDDDNDQYSDPYVSQYSTLPSPPRKTGGINIDNKYWKREEPAPPNTIPRPGRGTRADRHQVLPCDDGTVLYRGPCDLGTDWVRYECKNGVIGDKIIDGLVDDRDPKPKESSPSIFSPPKVTFEDTAHLQDQLAEAELFFDGDGHWDYQAEEEADRKLQIQSDLQDQYEEIQTEIRADQAYEAHKAYAAAHPDHPPPHLRLQNDLRQAEEETHFEKAEKVPLAHASSSSSSSFGNPPSGNRNINRRQRQHKVETQIDDSHASAITFLTNLHNEGKLEAPPRPRPAPGTGPRKESVVNRKEAEKRHRKAVRADGRYLHQHKVFKTPAEERQYLPDHLDNLWRICEADPSTL